MIARSTLKPCPFCGGTARAALRGDNYIQIGCKDGCECFTSSKVKSDGGFLNWISVEDFLAAYEEAAKKWNTRVGGTND